ncbi:unnamed protein product [Fraxinus pennsylvanica]|uniref:non-specific serine/threonine protein kinase n=1 Tax=Fraxinus pennsylvanica TaxID=56036 RepID=A0AAD2DXC3_9LAMI|nr:unnamed protein product [Fraxinus pennsylvanica]
MDNGDVVAFKKLWPATTRCSDEKSGVCDSFSAEVKTLGSIRHKNIVKFLGCYRNKSTRSLMYDYMPNGSLDSLLHDRNGTLLEWELRIEGRWIVGFQNSSKSTLHSWLRRSFSKDSTLEYPTKQ